MALVKGKFVDKDILIQSNNDPVDDKDLARKGYVDAKAASEAAAAEAAAIAHADSGLDLKQDSLGTGTTAQYLRGDLTWQALSIDPDVVYADDYASLPASGNDGVLYGTKDDNKLWRWGVSGSGLTPDWTVGASGDYASLELALADAAVQDGDVIQVQAGTYVISSAIQINKQVKIVGAGIGQTIIETAGATDDPVNVMVVSADNVLLKDMTIKHKKTSNTSIETAVVVSDGAFPTFRYVAGFIMDSCRVEYCEFGVVLRGNGFKLANNQIAYATGSISNSNRALGIYGSQGDCFIKDNVFDNSTLNGTAFRAIYSSSTNASSNEVCSGKLVISGNSHLGLLQQFYLQDNVRGSAGDYELFLLDNTTNETSVFSALFLSSENQADLFSQIVLENNSISNNHESSTGFGKGLFALDGAGSGLSYRSAALPIHSSGNTLGQTTFRADYAEAVGSSGSIVGYKPSVFAEVTVAFDSNIPAEPTAPETPGGAVAGYVEMSKDMIEDAIADGVTDKAPTQNAVYDALQLKLDSALKGAANGLAELDAGGKVPVAQLPGISITDTYVVVDEAAMLALAAEKGDIAIRSDLNKSFVLSDEDPTVLANWLELLTPTDAVLSVNGQVGAVSLDSDDIAEGATNKYFSDALAKAAAVADSITDGVTDVAPSQDAVHAALAGKADLSHTHVAADVTDFDSAAKAAAVVNSTAGSETDQAASVDAMKSYVAGEIAAITMPSGKKERFVLSAADISNGYVDCAFAALADTMILMTGGVIHNEGSGEDYVLSEVGGVTRITFEPDLAAMLVEGDDIYVQYLK